MDSLHQRNETLIAQIMQNNFRISQIQNIPYNQPISPLESPSYQESLSPTKQRRNQSVTEVKDLQRQIIDTVTQVCQLTIQEFTISIKKERVPIQKNILRKTSLFIEKMCMTLAMPEQALRKLIQKINDDQGLLVFAMCHISKPLLDFLENHFTDYAEELQITIQEVNLSLFQPKIIELIKQYISQSMNITQDSLYYIIFEQSQSLFIQLAHELSDQTCLILEECRGYIENLIIKFKDKNLPNLFQNKYFILSMFLELSRKCYQTIQDLLDFTIFHYAEPDVVEKFMKYAIENHDTLVLKNKLINTSQTHIKQKRTLAQVIDVINSSITNKNKPLSVYKIQNRYDPASQSSLESQKSTEDDDDEDYSPTKILASQMTDTQSFSTNVYSLLPRPQKIKHHTPSKLHLQGLYIEGEDAQTKFIVYLFRKEFIVVYAPLISKRWTFQKTFVIDTQEKDGFFKKDSTRKSGWGVYPVKFKNLKELLDSNWVVEQLAQMITWQQLSVDERYNRVKCKKFEGEMDTMFGSFLANVSRTNKLQVFLQNFGENAVNNGCLPQIIAYMPIVKDFLNLGGFGQQALITSQEIYTPERTFTPVSTLAISTSFVSGMVIGQVLIPLPLVGGLVGGLIGGYLGNKGITNYTKSRNLKKATELVQNLCQIQKAYSGMWECNKSTLDLLQINFKILGDTIPKVFRDDPEKQTKWMNLVTFAYLGLFYNQNQQPGVWVDCLEQSQKYLSMEKVPILEALDNLKSIIEIIVKNL